MKKFIASLVAVFVLLCCVCLGIGLGTDYQRVDTVYFNEVVQCLDNGILPDKLVYDFAVVDSNGKIKLSTLEVEEMSLQTRLSKAYAEGDVVMVYGEGKIIFYLKSRERFYSMRNTLIWITAVSFVVIAIVMGVGCWLIYLRTIKPFDKLRNFACEVAKGNLDSPLILDKHLTFGAFGEAFDIMRNNLRESRIAERNEMLEKRRLLQEIGHEIKTPLASIKAIAECGIAVSGDSGYGVICDKVSVIDNMVNDFYQKALEEDGQLNIFITKHSAENFKLLISESDYNGKVSFGDIPNCNVLYDKIRMTQIVDNIIANSYKYADTEIKVDFMLEDNMLKVKFKDFGKGVEAEQLSYIMERFYRGERTAEKVGQGLGLNICRKLILRMGGEMSCFNENGFVVELKLPTYNNF